MDAAEQAMGTGHAGILPVIGQHILHTETENVSNRGGGRSANAFLIVRWILITIQLRPSSNSDSSIRFCPPCCPARKYNLLEYNLRENSARNLD